MKSPKKAQPSEAWWADSNAADYAACVARGWAGDDTVAGIALQQPQPKNMAWRLANPPLKLAPEYLEHQRTLAEQ